VEVGFVGLGLSYTLWKITFWSLVTALATISVLILVVAVFLHRHQKRSNYTEVSTALRRRIAQGWNALPRKDKLSWLFLGFTVVLSIGLVPILMTGRQQPFAEFYIDTEFSETPPWQETLAPGNSADIPVTIISHEMETEDFHLEILIDDQQYHSINLGQLEPEQKTTSLIPLSTEQVGLHRIGLNLYRGEASQPYRSLHLWITVEEPSLDHD
jgi:uncharacterized membrane protein